MSRLKLPKAFRLDYPYRQCDMGVDLPREFIDQLRSIDRDLYPVWHEYRVLWDDLINTYSGAIDDPRFTVNYDHGALNFGFVLTDGNGAPIPERKWHIWRWSYPHGVAHICPLDSTDPEYLKLLVRRLYLQATVTDKYGFSSYSRLLAESDADRRAQLQKERAETLKEAQDENAWLTRRAMENLESGRTAPTNPKKESIYSYKGQSNRTKTERPLEDTDKESGIILPD